MAQCSEWQCSGSNTIRSGRKYRATVDAVGLGIGSVSSDEQLAMFSPLSPNVDHEDLNGHFAAAFSRQQRVSSEGDSDVSDADECGTECPVALQKETQRLVRDGLERQDEMTKDGNEREVCPLEARTDISRSNSPRQE